MVTGRILNVVTNEPMSKFPVVLNGYKGNEPHDSSNPKLVDSISTVTNEKGEFALELSKTRLDDAGLFLGTGYCYSHFGETYSNPIKANKSVETEIKIDPLNGRLDIFLQNQTAAFGTLFLEVDCDVLDGDKGSACCHQHFENLLDAGQIDTLHFRVTAGRFVKVYWGTTKFNNWNSPRVDSVFCEIGATTSMAINL